MPSTTTNAVDFAGGKVSITSLSVLAQNIVATAAQTSFTLSVAPSAVLLGVRNGSLLPTAFTFSGVTATYSPANNNAEPLVAGDVITFLIF